METMETALSGVSASTKACLKPLQGHKNEVRTTQ